MLWTACLLSSSSGAARADSLAGHGYLLRETGNLKCFAGGRGAALSPAPQALFDELQLQAELHREREQWHQQQLHRQESLTALTAPPHEATELEQLRALLLVRVPRLY